MVKLQKQTFNEKAAAEYLDLSVAFLRQGRSPKCQEKARRPIPTPPFIRLGRRIVYRLEDLDSWLEEHRVVMEGKAVAG